VLVFGQSGVGKTSMLNALLGLDLTVSSKATGCTFQSSSVMATPGSCSLEGLNFLFYDTVGLSETETGTTSADNSIAKLIQLLRSLKSGLNLLIFVTRAPRITDVTKKNYDLFVEIVADKKIPVICVVTGLENEDSMSDWIKQNQPSYTKANMKFISMVGTCFERGNNTRAESLYKPARLLSFAVLCISNRFL
jgi:predicted GTPase